jgi:endo-1,4-beta-xylanase
MRVCLLLLLCFLAGCVGQRQGGQGPSTEGLGGVDMKEGNAKYGEVPGVSLMGKKGARELVVTGDKSKVKVSFVPVTDKPFKEALRAEVLASSANNWDVQVHAMTTAPVKRGDVLLATFYFRTEWAPEESGEGQTEFVFELAKDPWTKSVSYPIRASRQWKQVFVPFAAAEDYDAGEAHLIFRLGFSPEIIDIAGVTLESFGKKLALVDLPRTKIVYGGMEPDAPWRAAAEQRIDKLRKSELSVLVTDKSGAPVPGANIKVTQKKQAFGWGTCAPAELLVGGSNQKFQQLIPELFNTVTLENDLKWVPLAGDWGTSFTVERAKRAVEWLRARDLAVRGHVLVWPGWKNLPRYLKGYEKQPEKLESEVERHIQELTSQMRGSLVHWDVLNEPFDNHDLIDIVGREHMVDWFKLARAADPGAKLFINDYAILSGGGGTTPHRDHYDNTIAYLAEQGAPFDGIGLQGHFGTSLTSADDILAILDRYGRFGRPIWITEYDIVMDDEELAGNYTRDLFTLLFSHQAVQGIVMWGFWDGSHWKQNAALYRGDWSEKPAAKAYRELVLGQWRTNASGTSDATGQYTLRAFHGEYSIVVTHAGKTKTIKTQVAPGSANVSVTLD